MKLKTLIKKLQKLEQKHGNIKVTIHSENADKGHTDVPCTITWFETIKNKDKACSVMLCDPYILSELGV